jgi:DNA-binding XRE family transcriptional regulator
MPRVVVAGIIAMPAGTYAGVDMPVSRILEISGELIRMVKNRLQFWRHQKGMEKGEFADFLEVGQSLYSRWENQHQQPNIESCFKIAKKLNIPIEALFEPPE